MLKNWLSNTRHIYIAEPMFFRRHQFNGFVIGAVVSTIVYVVVNVVYDKTVMFPDYEKKFMEEN